jgi:SNF2 family DNA or RNA helicase
MFWLQRHYVDEGRKVGFLHGAMSPKNKHQVVVDFQDSKFDLFLCQVKMAEGFNLHNSQDCIFLGRDWSPAVNHQAEDRLHRIGQKGTVNIQIPYVRGTIETLIHRKLMAKDADANQALVVVTVKELREAL